MKDFITDCRKGVVTTKNDLFWNVLQFFCGRNLLTFRMNFLLVSSVLVSNSFCHKSSKQGIQTALSTMGYKGDGNIILQKKNSSNQQKRLLEWRPPLWSSGQSFWLQIQRSRVRFPTLPDFSEQQWVWKGVYSAS